MMPRRPLPLLRAAALGQLLLAGAQGWVQNPVARHLACRVGGVNVPSVCRLVGHEDDGRELAYYVKTLPKAGLLYETSPNFRLYGSDPKNGPRAIGPHLLPYLVTDPLHRLVYVPPFNDWEPEGCWSSFTYVVALAAGESGEATSEEGVVALATSAGHIAGSTFDLAQTGDGWSIAGNFASTGSEGDWPKHQAIHWGGLSHYVYGVDEVQHLSFETGDEQAKWYFEAPSASFHIPELASAYGGKIKFTVRALYGNFSQLNSPLDWVTLECSACNSGQGLRLVKFTGDVDLLGWDGLERRVELDLLPSALWSRDPLNLALPYSYATECDLAAVLTNSSRLAILGDFTRGGEAVALDDVAVVAAAEDVQPSYPVGCQQGCLCKHDPERRSPLCC